MTYQISHAGKTTRLYHNADKKLVAVATNHTWKNIDSDRHMDSETQYFCLKGIWQADNQTMIVSSEKLAEIARGK